MIRLNFIVEGQTEETFIRDVLNPHLREFDVFTYARCIETGRKRGRIYRGGMTNYDKAKNDLQRWFKQDTNPETYFTNMFDLYRLPPSFPGYSEAVARTDPFQRISILEDFLSKDMKHPQDRFIPYIQLFEFEAILFSEPKKIGYNFPGRSREIKRLTMLRNKFETPEHINDDNPPSRRILSELPDYDKVEAGPLIALEIGLEKIRQECSHFNEWVSKLESLH